MHAKLHDFRVTLAVILKYRTRNFLRTAKPSECPKPKHKGDGFCNDENNVCGCSWDGGDCCGNTNKVRHGF